MFERFTDRARRVVVLAQDEARMLNHTYIGTEHILLGFLRDGEGVAAQVLEGLGIRLENARAAVEDIVGRGGSFPTGHIPFTPRAKKVLDMSFREAMDLRHNYIGTEHLLMGLTREGEGIAAQVIVTLGVPNMGVVRDAVKALLPKATVVADSPPRKDSPLMQAFIAGKVAIFDRASEAVISRAAELAAGGGITSAHLRQALEELGAT
jgi:ATP-dependent Clp protease ATP-binding subunit ClpA